MRDGENKVNLDRLWADYEQTFDTWALQVRRLKTLIGWSSSSAVVQEAELRVLAAECAYQESRDRLTEGLLRAEGETSSCGDVSSPCLEGQDRGHRQLLSGGL